jgi:hypothetical protein
MFIPIPIPIGATHVAAVQGAFWKVVLCAQCQESYAYLLQIDATGEEHDLLFLDAQVSSEAARAKAEENLLKKSHNVVLPVPCPHCGFYQDDMSRRLKDEASTNPLQIAGFLIALLAFVPLAFNIANIWIVTVVLAVAGLALLFCGYVVSFRFDPNAGDPAPRKLLGQNNAVWGERLAEVLATIPKAEPSHAPEASPPAR